MTRPVACLLLVLAAACGGDSGSVNEPETPSDTSALAVLDSGVVKRWYTAEVAALPGWAYTTTWGGYGGSVDVGAVLLWQVSGDRVELARTIELPGSVSTVDAHVSDDGRLLMVAGYDTEGFIAVFDVQDPGNPQLRFRGNTPGSRTGIHTAKFGRVNGKLYGFLTATSAGQLVIVDLSNPTAPSEVLVMKMGKPFVHDVFVRDGLLFAALWDDGFGIYDIGGGGKGGSPAAPALLSKLPIPVRLGGTHNVWWFHDPLTGSKRYAFVGEEKFQGVDRPTAGHMRVIDISNLEAPREVAYYAVPAAGAHNFWVDEPSGVLYIAGYQGGVRALDVRGDLAACPQTPCNLADRELAHALSNGRHMIWGVAGVGNRLYASDMLRGVYALSTSRLIR